MFLRDEEKKSMRRRRPPEWTHEYILGKNPAKPSVGPFDEAATQNAPEVIKRRRGRPPKGLHKLNPAGANMQSSDTSEAGHKGEACHTKRPRRRPPKLRHGSTPTGKAFEHPAADPEVEGIKGTKRPRGRPPKSPVLSLQPHGIASEEHEKRPEGLRKPISSTSSLFSAYTSESSNEGETSPAKRPHGCPPKQLHCSESSGEAFDHLAADPGVEGITVTKRPQVHPPKSPVLSFQPHGVASEVHERLPKGLHTPNSSISSLHSANTSESGNKGETNPIKRPKSPVLSLQPHGAASEVHERLPKGLHKPNSSISSLHSANTSESGNKGETNPIKRPRGRPPKRRHCSESSGAAFEHLAADPEVEGIKATKRPCERPPKSPVLSLQPHGVASEVHERLPEGLHKPNSTTSNLHSASTSESGNEGETSHIKRRRGRSPKQHHFSGSPGEAFEPLAANSVVEGEETIKRPLKSPIVSFRPHGVAPEVHGRSSEGLHLPNSSASNVHSAYTSEAGNEGEASPTKPLRGRPPKQHHFSESPGRALESPGDDSITEGKEKIKRRRGRPPKSLFLSVNPHSGVVPEANGGNKVKKRRRRKEAAKVDPLLMRHGHRPPKRLLLAKREAFPESTRLRHDVKKSH
jgi:hypothetical protein